MLSVLKRVSAVALIAMMGAPAQASNLSAECSMREESSCLVSMVLAYYANQTYGIDIAVEERIMGEISALRLASNRLSLAIVKPETFEMLEAGNGVFGAYPETAEAASKHLRALFGFEDEQGRMKTIAVNDQMGYELAYNITASFWNNFPSIKREVSEMNGENQPFVGINMPLHPGALYYFESRGYEVPATLR